MFVHYAVEQNVKVLFDSWIKHSYSKNPFGIPEGTHFELAFQVNLQIDIMTEQLYYVCLLTNKQ